MDKREKKYLQCKIEPEYLFVRLWKKFLRTSWNSLNILNLNIKFNIKTLIPSGKRSA
jgi:hypothetical protein